MEQRSDNMPLPRTSFTQSRDWFGFFYDDVFCPPKCFHLVVEWRLGCDCVAGMCVKVLNKVQQPGRH